MNSRPETPSPTDSSSASPASLDSAPNSTESPPADDLENGSSGTPKATSPGVLDFLMFQQLPLQNETTYFILVNVLDIVMTNLLLRWGAIEANPLAAYVLHRWGFQAMIAFKLVLVAAICILAQLIARRSMSRARFVLITGIIIVAAVVIYSASLFYTQTRA